MNNIKLNGFLCVNKPVGISSNTVLSIIKRLTKKQVKVGHLGTLDPLANGVLPIALGEATKVIPYITNHSKKYIIEIKWGEQTTTDDTEGEVVKTSNNRPALEDLEKALKSYVGNIKQTPPNFSACWVNGTRAYDLARKGKEVNIQAKDVCIDSIDIISFKKDIVKLEVACSKGTYMRSLARDLGLDLNCYGHCISIERVASGNFKLEDSIIITDDSSLEDIECGLLKIGSILKDVKSISLTEEENDRIRNGLEIDKSKSSDIMLAIYEGLESALIKEVTTNKLRAIRVFNLK